MSNDKSKDVELDLLRLSVGTAAGLNPTFALHLKGSNRQELEADAEKFKRDLLSINRKPNSGALSGFNHAEPLANLKAIRADENELNNPSGRYSRMTDYEKDNKRAALQQLRQSAASGVTAALAKDWAAIKQEYRDLQAAKRGANDRSARKWDFQRLSYERQKIRDFLEAANPDAIIAKYKQTALDQDAHALRAFAEVARETLARRSFPEGDYLRLSEVKNDLGKMVEQLTITQEQKDLAKKGADLTRKIDNLYTATQETKAELRPAGFLGGDHVANGQVINPNPLDVMSKGVMIKKTAGPDLELITEVTVSDDWDGPATSNPYQQIADDLGIDLEAIGK